jgi:Mg/Co/Ni transporter MgtE
MATTINHNQSGQRVRWALLSLAGAFCGLIVALAFGAPLQTVVGLLLITPILTGMVGVVRSLTRPATQSRLSRSENPR